MITTFLIQVGRITADDSLPWGKVMDMVIDEPEHLVKKTLLSARFYLDLSTGPGKERLTRLSSKNLTFLNILKIYIAGLHSLPTMDFIVTGRFVMLLVCWMMIGI